MICSAITIGSGGSAGVEGPSAQIGGAVGSSVGRFFKMSSSRVRALISCGAAAGLAAQFNAPITGILFAQEVIMMGKLEMDVFSAIVIASGVATMISRTHATGKPLFGFFEYTSSAFTDIILYALMGLLIGLLAFAFIRVFLYTKDLFKGIRLPMVVKMLLGSLIVGLMGLFQPGVMGDGYEYILRALRTPIEINFYVLGFLVVMKMIATSVTLGSGNFGGVFAPSLFIGAMFGGFFAGVVNIILPSVGIPEGSYALIGMGAFLAATTHAPLTSIFLLFEITGNYEVIVPVMISSVIGMMVCKNFSPESIDTAELARKGIRLHQGQEVSVLSSIKVEEIMNKDYETVSEHALFSEFIRMIQHGKQQYYPVMNRAEEFVGIVSLQDVREFMMDDGLEDLVLISEIMETRLITLHPEETLDRAMEKFTLKDIEVLPVVAPDNPWMSAIFYMPRILVHYSEGLSAGEDVRRLAIMGKKLYRFGTGLAVLGITSGSILWLYYGIGGNWMNIKLGAVALLIGYHTFCIREFKRIARGGIPYSGKFYRIYNEISVLLLLLILIMVIMKPEF
ncbi:hypothetical protein CHS0354_027364 [Potamilus streckersoni]|uniref:Chloride channel protein n=1 Tax=Potamilus streckersoni TaxID=2493646 RepID=A0AAE0SQB5_9BIVA|nr:hypothetical protein CHS0354_027364 [Potamilus streckersoni]